MVDQHSRRRRGQADSDQRCRACWALSFVGDFDLLGYMYKRNGTCEAEVARTLMKGGMHAWFEEAHMHVS